MGYFTNQVLFLILLTTIRSEELKQAESKDKLEIVKQIKKVNDDGSYTVGYEADDGSFKIESRDVLGNIKGTYGYLDDAGQVKRVSYSTSNASTEVLPKPEAQILPTSSVVQRIPLKGNSTTRKPFYLTRSTSTTQSTPTLVYASRPLVRSTQATLQKQQLVRPEVSKPVTEETSNILRRQSPTFNPQQHVYTLQQSMGTDSSDIYGGSIGTARPLFTTTSRPIKYDLSTPQESTTENTVSSTPVPVVQIPAGQYQNNLIPKPEQAIYVRRAPQFRPIPVQVDENGFIRPVAGQQIYPVPVPVQPQPIEEDIERISPPVSTRDFQKLLQQLILRQTRLERISTLTDPRRHPELYQPRYRYPYEGQYQDQRLQDPRVTQYEDQRVRQYEDQRARQYEDQRARQYQDQRVSQFEDPRIRQYEDPRLRQQYQREEVPRQYEPYPQPTRRVARLQPQNPQEYLPVDVREMLLLRMLQLAINPALPLAVEDEEAQASTANPQKVRNVEILGEELEDKRKAW